MSSHLFNQNKTPTFYYQPAEKPYFIKSCHGEEYLDILYRLSHNLFVQKGVLEIQASGKLNLYPQIDSSSKSCILFAFYQEQIVGSLSITEDGEHGLSTDIHFKKESQSLRLKNAKMLSSYRMISTPLGRGTFGFSLVMDLIKCGLHLAIEAYDFDRMLLAFGKRHEKLYQQLVGAKSRAYKGMDEEAGILEELVLMSLDRGEINPKLLRALSRMEKDIKIGVS